VRREATLEHLAPKRKRARVSTTSRTGVLRVAYVPFSTVSFSPDSISSQVALDCSACSWVELLSWLSRTRVASASWSSSYTMVW